MDVNGFSAIVGTKRLRDASGREPKDIDMPFRHSQSPFRSSHSHWLKLAFDCE